MNARALKYAVKVSAIIIIINPLKILPKNKLSIKTKNNIKNKHKPAKKMDIVYLIPINSDFILKTGKT